jgi:hypothetical protein
MNVSVFQLTVQDLRFQSVRLPSDLWSLNPPDIININFTTITNTITTALLIIATTNSTSTA